MKKLFIDTNIILDLLAKRKDYASAAKLFTLADKGEVELFVSSLTFANTNYILTKLESKEKGFFDKSRDIKKKPLKSGFSYF
jgi:predicted nucleic acid-binding protein